MGQKSSSQNQSQHQCLPPANYDLPPLSFHSKHGVNITLTEEAATAIRNGSYCNGILFTHRPVMVGERICLKIKNLSTQWSGALKIGFSAHDPSRYKGRLPKHACPDLVNKSGFWCKSLGDHKLTTNTIFHYYVSAKGDVHLGVDGGDFGIFIRGIDTRQPLWGLIDLYGNCTSIELMDSRRSSQNINSTRYPSPSAPPYEYK